jgi:serine-type D-Ala-D-Ala carboxypeptidase
MTQTKPDALRFEVLRVAPQRLEYLDTYLKQLIDKGEHPFIGMRVLRRGALIFNGAYGVSPPNGAALKEDAIYPLASLTKPFVATLLAVLQEDGLIDLWDKFNKYYPEFTGEHKDEVEIWQVLAHCSGMSGDLMDEHINAFVREKLGRDKHESFTDEEYTQVLLDSRESLGLPPAKENGDSVWEVEALLSLRAPLASAPHTAYNYCGLGYQLFVKLIERLTGESIDSYAQRKLFEPLNMSDTYFVMPQAKWARAVKRPETCPGADWLNSEALLVSTSGSGGLKSTMRDLANFGQMYLQKGTLGNARVLSPASIRLMTTDHNAGLPPTPWFGRTLGANWGLGWNLRCDKKDDTTLLRSPSAFDHGGFGGARLLIDPENDLVVSLYMADKDQNFSANLSRAMNIVYTALD